MAITCKKQTYEVMNENTLQLEDMGGSTFPNPFTDQFFPSIFLAFFREKTRQNIELAQLEA